MCPPPPVPSGEKEEQQGRAGERFCIASNILRSSFSPRALRYRINSGEKESASVSPRVLRYRQDTERGEGRAGERFGIASALPSPRSRERFGIASALPSPLSRECFGIASNILLAGGVAHSNVSPCFSVTHTRPPPPPGSPSLPRSPLPLRDRAETSPDNGGAGGLFELR